MLVCSLFDMYFLDLSQAVGPRINILHQEITFLMADVFQRPRKIGRMPLSFDRS